MHLELRIFRSAHMDRPTSLDLPGWNEPAPPVGHQHEQEFESRRIELLHYSCPALVSARGRKPYRVVTCPVDDATRRLHLNSRRRDAEIGDPVVIGTVEEGNGDDCPDQSQPLDRECLPEISLPPWVKSFSHEANICSFPARWHAECNESVTQASAE